MVKLIKIEQVRGDNGYDGDIYTALFAKASKADNKGVRFIRANIEVDARDNKGIVAELERKLAEREHLDSTEVLPQEANLLAIQYGGLIEPKRERVETVYIARHGEDFGRGHFADKEFDTLEEAQDEIDRTINGIKSHDHSQTVADEYKAYWKEVGENMYIEKATTFYEVVGKDDSVAPSYQERLVSTVKGVFKEVLGTAQGTLCEKVTDAIKNTRVS